MNFEKVCLLVTVVAFVGCSSLSEAGKKVRVSSSDPEECIELGNVTSGTIASKPSPADVLNDLRNQAARMKGNLLVKDSIGKAELGGFFGSGRVFKCPSKI